MQEVRGSNPLSSTHETPCAARGFGDSGRTHQPPTTAQVTNEVTNEGTSTRHTGELESYDRRGRLAVRSCQVIRRVDGD